MDEEYISRRNPNQNKSVAREMVTEVAQYQGRRSPDARSEMRLGQIAVFLVKLRMTLLIHNLRGLLPCRQIGSIIRW